MENEITMDATPAKSTEELDAQLVSTLREIDPHNYPYLFERCKSCNVHAHHLRFFKKNHIRELIPKSELGITAEFEYLLSQWQISKGYASFDAKIQLNRTSETNGPKRKPQAQSNLDIANEKPHIPSNNQPVVVLKQEIDIKPQISSPAMIVDESDELLTELDSDENSNISHAKRMKFDEDDLEKFTLETIIPDLLQNFKDSYEWKNSLSPNERSFLCNSIVDYFLSRKIKFSSDTMDDLAEQIVAHFPTEDKKSWCNHDGFRTRGRFYFRFHNARRNKPKHTNDTSTSKIVTNSTSSEDENSKISNAQRMKFVQYDYEEQFTLEEIVPELLKNLKDSYELKNSLSTNERRFLCSSIVDYFVSRKLKFSLDTMDDLAEQIVKHFPTEVKKSWFNRDGPNTRGRLFFRVSNARRKMSKPINSTSTSKAVTNSNSSEDEDNEEKFTLETIIPELLKELKDSYESKNSLSTNERRFLCSGIVDYFENRKIKFSSVIMDDLAEQIVAHFPTEDKKSWCNRDGRSACGRFVFSRYNSRRYMAKQTSTNFPSRENEYGIEKFTLEEIVPELLKDLKDSYKTKTSLSRIERSLLCSSIVDYFESRRIKFSLDTMSDLARQISEHFPTEDKKSWCNRDGRSACGSFVYRLYNLRRNMAKQTNNTSTSKVVTNSASSEDESDEEPFTLEEIIPELLKELKISYESKNSLSTNERRLLCGSIVNYFVSKNINFRFDTMDELAEQIVEQFPTEDKKSWCNRDGSKTCGRFYFRLINSRRKIGQQTNTASTSKLVTSSTSSADEGDEEQFTLEDIVPELLKDLKDSHESKNSLTTNERSFLCSSIVDYFESRNIKFRFDIMDALAKQIVKHFPTEDKKSWYNRDGPFTHGRLYYRLKNSRRNMAKRTNNTSTSKDATSSASSADEADEEQFTLEEIIPELLKDLKDSHESKNSLTQNERSFLCSSIVDYFESRKIKFSPGTMADLAEQIVEHFPTEDKKSWYNRDGPFTNGRLYFRLYNSRRNMEKQTNNASTSKVVTHFASSEYEDEVKFTLEAIIPDLLKELKDSYESKNSLTTNERRFLCSAIVDYFESRNIHFRSGAMDELAEQIVKHFPTEDKKSWHSRNGPRTCGRFYFRLRNSCKNKQLNNSSTSKITLEEIIPELLKNLKDVYESHNSLSTNERRVLCGSIVDYFESRNINLSLDTMAELAEQIVEHFPTEDKKSWHDRDGPKIRGRLFIRRKHSRSRKYTNNTLKAATKSNSSEDDDDDDEEEFTLEEIIPELLQNLKNSYELKNSLSTNQRRVLCNSIVGYFESRKIKFSLDTMDDLAEQIFEHFPTEDKKSWCNRDGRNASGRLVFRLRNTRRNMNKIINNLSTSKDTDSGARELEPHEEFNDEDSKSIQARFKSHKCANSSEIIDLWEHTMKFRFWQRKTLKDLKSILKFLNNWPPYKLETAHELLAIDFEYLYPQAMETFRIRWLVYKQNIEQFLKVELNDVYCIKLLKKYELQKAIINEDSSSCILIYLVHAITKPLRHFESVSGNVSYAITDSQHSMMRLIRHKAEIEAHTEPYPCIFLVGDSLLNVQECYVAFLNLRYKLSYEKCLAACVQIFTVFKVGDPPASQCFWEFIRGYMFNITKDKENFNLATENMVNYLKTAASSI